MGKGGGQQQQQQQRPKQKAEVFRGYPGYGYLPSPSAGSSAPATAGDRSASCYEYAAVSQQQQPPHHQQKQQQQNGQRQTMQEQGTVHREQGYQQRALSQRKQQGPHQQRTTPQMLMRSDMYAMEDRVKTYVAGTEDFLWEMSKSSDYENCFMQELH
ncbi:hypothetical protein RUM44_008751 [Polyplax serrata]|uniref:Uncharacterized protein n=1 Tax=Polyplax serrata TaxID=468196 RepID=A0ABR1B9E7_POLSC